MDEVGYLVRNIEDNGNLLVSSVGGIWPTAVIGTKAKVVTNKDNKEAIGVFGHTSIHILEAEKRTKAPLEKELFCWLWIFKQTRSYWLWYWSRR